MNADFNRFRNDNLNFKNDLDTLLKKHLAKSGFFANKTEEDEPYVFLVSQLNYDEQYETIIVIPNLDVMDVSKVPITSSGLDLEDDELEDHDEAIWAKEYEPCSQEFMDIILKEQSSLGKTKPIFIFANGENEDKYIGKQIFDERMHIKISYKTDATNSTRRFDHQDMNIKSQSYERDWYASAKNTGQYTYNGQTAYLVGKRVYTSEWYLSENGVVLNGANVPMWQYIHLQSYNSKFQITRVQ